MNPRTIVLIVAALLIAGGTAFLARTWIAGQRVQTSASQPATPKPESVVLVAKSNVPAGTFIKEEHLRWQEWPTDSVDPNYLLQGSYDPKTLIGAVVRRGIFAGEPITDMFIVRPGERGFLAAVLKPGMRAVSIGISDTSANAGLVFPGDRVDLILTHNVPASEIASPYERRASETVLENLRILAIGQSMNDQSETPIGGKTATIEVTPKQVEMIAVVAELGRLSLSLRSLVSHELNPTHSTEQTAAVVTATDGKTGDEGAMPGIVDNPLDDPIEPARGDSFTLDNEVSHLLLKRGANQRRNVTVVRGAAVEIVVID